MTKALHSIPVFLLLFLFGLPAFRAAGQVANSAWVFPSATGNLLYQLDDRGQRIVDFSQCGYRGGTEPLPNVTALIPQNRWVYLSPDDATADTVRIQAAIDSVEAMTPDANGWRGVVYLNAGEYQLATTLNINASGVVLKGVGDDPTTGSRLRATGTTQYTLIKVSGSGSRSTVAGTTSSLTQKLVPAGTRTFEVASTSGLAVGHTVIVKRPSTTNWIADIDMDQLGPAPVVPWTEGSKDLLFDRTITRIEGNWITVDVPLPQTFESKYGGGQIWRYTWAGRIQQVGIEDIYGFSDHVSATDENHSWRCIQIGNAQHAWVRNITAQYFAYAAVSVTDGAKWLTVADSQCLDPISLIDGGRRYSFNNDGAECTLFVNNYARKGRHDYVFGGVVPGPNVFVHSSADTVYNDVGPHQRWAVGGLFDALTINGNDINVQNRGNSGTGHGWAGAYMTVWNCAARGFRVRNPPTARNWLVGSIGSISASSGPVGADPAGTYDSSGPSGSGKVVHPRSLYYGQLQQRMKWPGSEFREVWLGDVDQHSSTGGTGETVNCDATWLTQVEAIGILPAVAKFDQLVGNRHTAFTLDFPRDPGDTIVAASLTVSLRAIGSAATDNIWLDSTTSPQTFASLGWTPLSTTAPTVGTMEVSPALLADGRLNVALGTNNAVDFAVLHLQVQTAQPSTSTIMLAPVADAYVQGGVNAGTNYGTATALITKGDSNLDLNRETFLRWDLSGISGKIVQAKVRLAGTSAAQTGNESCANFVSDDAWAETTLNFTNKPAAGKLFAQWLPVTGQAAEFTVTPQVVATLLDHTKLLSLRILSTDNFGANGNVSYASRENPTAANRPQLILTIENPPTAVSKAATGSALNLGTAWTPAFVPVNPDTATWNASSLAGIMTLGADLSWASLVVSNPAGPLTFNGTQFLSLGSGGIDMSASPANLTLNHPVLLGEDQTWNVGTGTLAANGRISGPSTLTKAGTGNLILSGANTFTGTTTIDQGTLAFTTTNALSGGITFGAAATNITPGILDLTTANATFAGTMLVNTNSAAASEIKIGPAQTLTSNNNVQIGAITPAVTGTVTNLIMTGGGSFKVTTAAAGTFRVGGGTIGTSSQVTTLDLTALKATTINTSSTGTLRVNPVSGSQSSSRGVLLLPAPSLVDTIATTTVTAGTLAVGDSSTNTNNGAGNPIVQGSITLGTGLTTLNVNTINIGTGGRDVGQIIYGSTLGDLMIRAADGGSRATAINIATGGASGSNTGNSRLDLSGHDADILVTSLNVGNQAKSGSVAIGTYEFSFGEQTTGVGVGSLASKLDATNVNIGFRTGTVTTTSTMTSKVNLSGGTVTFGNVGASGTGVDIGNSSYSGAGVAKTVGELNISGGNVTIHNGTGGFAVRLGQSSAANGGIVTASMNLTGGTITLGGDLIKGTATGTVNSTLKLAGGTLDLGGNVIGATGAAAITLTAESGTLKNVATINGTGGLTKTTAGTLVLSGSNTYTGPTAVTAGTLALDADNVLPDASAVSIGSATLDAATFDDTLGTLDVTGGAVINLGAGANLVFANSSGIDWTGGTLNLTGTFVSGSSLRFGTTRGGLTSSQLSKIAATGFTSFALDASGDLTANAAGFSSWITGTFANGQVPTNQRGPNDDPDNDSIRNLVEYAIASQDPTVANASVGSVSADALSFTKRAGTSGLTYAIQKSTDLGLTDPWTAVTGVPPVYVNDGSTISYSFTPGTPVINFLRLQVLSN